jgi:hypothetical protein
MQKKYKRCRLARVKIVIAVGYNAKKIQALSQRGLVGSALACCKAGPSSNLGSAHHGGSAH